MSWTQGAAGTHFLGVSDAVEPFSRQPWSEQKVGGVRGVCSDADCMLDAVFIRQFRENYVDLNDPLHVTYNIFSFFPIFSNF